MSPIKGKKMSEQTNTPAPIKFSLNYLDGSLQEQSKELEYTFVPAETIAEAMTRLDGNPDAVLSALNSAVEDLAKEKSKATAGITDMISKRHFLDMAAPWRGFEQYSVDQTDKDGNITSKGKFRTRAEATEAIRKDMAQIPPILEMLKSKSKSDPKE
jgi:hypothetical protein